MSPGPTDPFDRHDPVAYGRAEVVAPGVRRIVAPNPSPMTFTGTSTYLVGGEDLGGRDLAVIDPGPDDVAHRAALLAEIGGARVRAILVTHSHLDHSGGAARLAAELGAPLLGFGPHGAGMSATMRALAAGGAALGGGEGAHRAFAPNAAIGEGERIAGTGWTLTALHTPGHLSNHLCFALEDRGVLFSGDAVMAWSTTLVSPPDGDMRAFLGTLRRLRGRGDRLFLPGHGPPLRDPAAMIDWQIAHRAAREAAVLTALEGGPADAATVAGRVYAGLDPALRPAAARNAFAHLLALMEEGRAVPENAAELSTETRFLRR